MHAALAASPTAEDDETFTEAARSFAQTAVSLVYDAKNHVLRAADPQAESAAPSVVLFPAGLRAARAPIPYIVKVCVNGGTVGKLNIRVVREETRGMFINVAEADSCGYNAAWIAETHPGGEIDLVVWAAPEKVCEHGMGPESEKFHGKEDCARAVLEVDVDGAVASVILSMIGTAPLFTVKCDKSVGAGSPCRQALGVKSSSTATDIMFYPAVANSAFDERRVTITNITAGAAPLIVNVILVDSAGDAYEIREDDDEDNDDEDSGITGEAIRDDSEGGADPKPVFVIPIGGNKSYSFVVRYKENAGDPLVVDCLGHAAVRLPVFVSNVTSHTVDKDLLHPFDHVINLIRPASRPLRITRYPLQNLPVDELHRQQLLTPTKGVPSKLAGPTLMKTQLSLTPLIQNLPPKTSAISSHQPVYDELQPQRSMLAYDELNGDDADVTITYGDDYADDDNDRCRDLAMDDRFTMATPTCMYDSMNNQGLSFEHDIDDLGLAGGYGLFDPGESPLFLVPSGPDGHFLAEAKLGEHELLEIDCGVSPEQAPLLETRNFAARLHMPRELVDAGALIIGPDDMDAIVPFLNASKVPVRVLVSRRSARYADIAVALHFDETTYSDIDTILQPGDVVQLDVSRKTVNSCSHTISLRCVTADPSLPKQRRTKYEIPVIVHAPTAHFRPPTDCATDRPAIAFYGCALARGEQARTQVVRIYNGSDATLSILVLIENERRFGSIESTGEKVSAGTPSPGAFEIVGHVASAVAPLQSASLSVAFHGLADAFLFSGDLRISVGDGLSLKHRTVPLFGYGGASDLQEKIIPAIPSRCDIKGINAETEAAGRQCVVENNGTRPGLVKYSAWDWREQKEVLTRHLVGPGLAIALDIPLAPMPSDYASDLDNTVCTGLYGRIELVDDIMQSRILYCEKETVSGEHGFDWSAVHGKGRLDAFHYDDRVMEMICAKRVSSIIIDPETHLPAISTQSPAPLSRWGVEYQNARNQSGQHVHYTMGDRVVVVNRDFCEPLEFFASGAEPRHGVVPPLGEATLYVHRVDVEVRARGEKVEAESMVHI
jgi:hypothetical protein